MYTIQLEDFQIEQIARSGQCFRLVSCGDQVFSLVAGEHYIEISQTGSQITFSGSQKEWEEIWMDYFDCGRDYGAIKKRIDPQDTYLSNAAIQGWGIRILHQDVWEMIITFIISQQNNIKRIRKCVETICERYGEKRINFHKEPYYLFPTPEALAAVSVEELIECNLGYRAKYIQKTAQMIVRKEVNLKSLPLMTYEDAKKEVMKLCGVGTKVAECICLFGLQHMNAFPIDTHIQKVLKEHYAEGFPFERYKDCAGILQQYIFFNDL